MEKENLIKDLEKLNEEYNKLNDTHNDYSKKPLNTIEHNKNLVDSGQLIIDFYNNIFIPKYSHSQNPIMQKVDNSLWAFSFLAEKRIKDKSYIGLDVLLIPRGSKFTDLNNLESLIQDLQNNPSN